MKFQSSDLKSRTVFTVTRHLAGWAVEHDGEMLDPSRTKEEARAAASRRARACQDAGQPCQINISGETGFFQARVRSAPALAVEIAESGSEAPTV